MVAADLVSQAEHDVNAAAVLVTPSQDLADAVVAELELQVAATKHTERVRVAIGGRQSAIVLVDDLDHGLEVADAYAAEHLEIHTRDARAVAAAGPERRSDLRRAAGRRCRSGTTAPAPTTCCRPPERPRTSAGCRSRHSCAASS